MIQDTDQTLLTTDTPVEVWCNSFQKWVSGFAIVDWDGERAAVRRVAEEAALPERFPVEHIRPAATPSSNAAAP